MIAKYRIQCIGWGIAAVIFAAFLVLMLVDAAFFPHAAIGRFARTVLEFPILPWLTGRQAFFLGIGWKFVLALYVLHRKKLLLGPRGRTAVRR